MHRSCDYFGPGSKGLAQRARPFGSGPSLSPKVCVGHGCHNSAVVGTGRTGQHLAYPPERMAHQGHSSNWTLLRPKGPGPLAPGGQLANPSALWRPKGPGPLGPDLWAGPSGPGPKVWALWAGSDPKELIVIAIATGHWHGHGLGLGHGAWGTGHGARGTGQGHGTWDRLISSGTV